MKVVLFDPFVESMMARYRSENKLTPQSYTFMYNGSPNYGTGMSVGYIRSMTDTLTPGYRKLVREGKIIMNYMESIRQDITNGVISRINGYANGIPFYDAAGSLEHISCAWLGPTSTATRYNLVSAADVNSLVKEVSTRCLSQIGRSDANNWENMAEFGKTLQMFKAPLRNYRKWYNEFGKIKRKFGDPRFTVAGQVEDMTAAWLSLRYGVQPIITSWIATEKQLRDRGGLGPAKPVRETTRASRTISARGSSIIDRSDGTYISSISEQITESHTVRAMSLDEMVWTWADTVGLGSKDLITLPWELIPYSFVVDWFLNVGDFLGAMSQYMYPKSLAQCHSIQSVRSIYRETLNHTTPANYTLSSKRKGWVREDTVWKTRYPGLHAPSLVFKSNFRLDEAARLGDSMSLIGQQLSRIFLKRASPFGGA